MSLLNCPRTVLRCFGNQFWGHFGVLEAAFCDHFLRPDFFRCFGSILSPNGSNLAPLISFLEHPKIEAKPQNYKPKNLIYNS